jgi:hypothetical protein
MPDERQFFADENYIVERTNILQLNNGDPQ